MRCVVNVAACDAFPPFLRPHLTAMFVGDYWENKPYIMRELGTIVSSHSRSCVWSAVSLGLHFLSLASQSCVCTSVSA